jgi:transcriptional regulator
MFLPEPMVLDDAAARRLIDSFGRATIVTAGASGLRATYGFMLLEPATEGDPLTVVGHIARADPQADDLVAGVETLLVFDGPHGYVSPSWYRPQLSDIPGTWNYSAVHVRGRPQPLAGEEAFDVLRRTVERHEAALADGERWQLSGSALTNARRLAPGTCVFRLAAEHVEAKAKHSQDKPPVVREAVIRRLAEDGPYANEPLAAEMRRIADG